MGFERSKGILDGEQVMTVVVLLKHLLMQSVRDASLKNVRVVGRIDLAAGRGEGGRMLAKQLDVFLRSVPGLVNFLAPFDRSFGQLLVFILDLDMQSLQDWQHRRLQILFGFQMGIGNTLGIAPQIFKKSCYSAQLLIEMMTFFERRGNCLQYFLIFLGLGMLDFGGLGDVVL